jgi:hypothetical protein
MQEGARGLQSPGRSEVERDGKDADEEKAEADHEAEAPKQRRNRWNGVPSGLRYFGVACVEDVRPDLLQEKRVA